VLGGAAGPPRDFVLANAAAGLLVAGRVDSLKDGVQMGLDALRSGRAAAKMERLAQSSQSAEAGG